MTIRSYYSKKGREALSVTYGDSSPRGRAKGLHAIFCHSEPVTDVTGVGIRPRASLCEGGVTAKGRDGGRDTIR